MKRFFLVVLILFLITGCQEKFFLSIEKKQDKEDKDNSIQLPIKKTNGVKALVYTDDSLKDEKYKNIKRPIINLNSDYAKSINDHLKIKMADTISSLTEEKASFPSLDYEIFDNEDFISILVKQSVRAKETYTAYNISYITGGPVSINEIDKKLGFDGKLQGIIEDDIVNFNKIDIPFVLQKFWDFQYKGFPQVYVKDNEVFAILNDRDGDTIIKISKDFNYNNENTNQLYEDLNQMRNFDQEVFYLGQVKSVEEATELSKNFMAEHNLDNIPSLLNSKNAQGQAYLIVPKMKNTLLRILSLDKQSGVLAEDMTNPSHFILDSSYLVVFIENDKKCKKGIEMIYRGERLKITEEDFLNNNFIRR